jgi:hypothetical protein
MTGGLHGTGTTAQIALRRRRPLGARRCPPPIPPRRVLSLIAHLAEVDARRLYARYASPSMFLYCRDVLHLSEGEGQLRITVAKAAREHPVLLEMLADGRLHLSGIARLAPILTPENRDRLLARAVHKSKRQIEEMVAELAPRPDAPSVVRKLPERRAPSPLAAFTEVAVARPGAVDASLRMDIIPPPLAMRRPVFEPLSPARLDEAALLSGWRAAIPKRGMRVARRKSKAGVCQWEGKQKWLTSAV